MRRSTITAILRVAARRLRGVPILGRLLRVVGDVSDEVDHEEEKACPIKPANRT